MSSNLLYSENPKMPRNNPFMFTLIIILNIAGLVAAIRLDQQSFQIIGLVVWLGTVIWLLIWYIKIKSIKVSVTNNDILVERGLLRKNRKELAIDKIRTVEVDQDFIDRIFGVGMIKVFTAGDLAEIEVKGLPNPNKIRELVKKIQHGLEKP
tara:strand:+ start:708 stop:1163 length:456 start_codon:yes stop_codon:yes gene_type:complete